MIRLYYIIQIFALPMDESFRTLTLVFHFPDSCPLGGILIRMGYPVLILVGCCQAFSPLKVFCKNRLATLAFRV